MGAAEKHQRGRQVGVLRPHSLPSVPTGPQHIPGPACPVLPLPPPLYHVASQALVCPVLTGSLWAPQDRWRGNKRLGEAGIPGERGPRVPPGGAMSTGQPRGCPPGWRGRGGSLRIRPSSSAHTPPATRGPPVISLLVGVCLSQGHSCTKSLNLTRPWHMVNMQ